MSGNAWWQRMVLFATSRDALISKHGADYIHLKAKFGKRLWHGLTRKAAFAEAGFVDTYDDFYRPTSEMAHAEPSRYVMRDNKDAWVFGRSDLKEARYLCGAYLSSYSLLLAGMEQINQAFDLQFGERLAACKKSLYEFAPQYKEALLSIEKGKYEPILRGLRTVAKIL